MRLLKNSCYRIYGTRNCTFIVQRNEIVHRIYDTRNGTFKVPEIGIFYTKLNTTYQKVVPSERVVKMMVVEFEK